MIKNMFRAALLLGLCGAVCLSHAQTRINPNQLPLGFGSSQSCEIIEGSPSAAALALADDDDSPDVCKNDTGATLKITAVSCYANAGSPTVLPIITGGSSTSILSGNLTCTNTQGGAAGTLNGTPTQTNGQTIDANIVTAGGTATYLVVHITRTAQ